jgi:hypothetical protein
VKNSDDEYLNISTAAGSLNRIDLIVLRWSKLDRSIELAVVEGVADTEAVEPELTRDADTYELCLAKIAVNKAITEITDSLIADTRNDNSYCGYVSGLVDQIETTDLFKQFTDSFNTWWDEKKKEASGFYDESQNQFETWFKNIKDKLDGDTAGKLQNEIDNLSKLKADKIDYDDDAGELQLLSGSTILSTTLISSEKQIGDVISPNVEQTLGGANITWVDPEDIVDSNGKKLSIWAGTLVVRKKGSVPNSPEDGDIVTNSTERNQHSNNAFFDVVDFELGSRYYYRFFPYTVYDKYTYGSISLIEIKAELVPWSVGTDAQITDMVEKYYSGVYSLEDIKSVWSVGDARTVSLSAMSATGVDESHIAQSQQFVILDFDHDVLTNANGDKTKSLITVQQLKLLSDGESPEIGYMNAKRTNTGGWDACERRTWCNEVYLKALPDYIQKLVKAVDKITSIGDKNEKYKTSSDFCFLPSYIELQDTTKSFYLEEGTQYEYYKLSSSLRKYYYKASMNTECGHSWYTRSPYDGGSEMFRYVNNDVDGIDYSYAQNSYGLAPCFCL